MAAEGLGLAASVAGLVSLGLQITGGIVQYLDALDRREDDLAHARQQNQTLITTLSALETVSAGLHTQHLVFTDTLVQDIQRCKKALSDAERLRIELTDGKNATWTTRLGNTKKKLTYKFQESKLRQLSQRLQQTNEVLQLTLNGLQVELSMLNTTKLTAIESSSQSISSKLHHVNSGVEAIRERSMGISTHLPVLQDSVDSVAHRVEYQSGLILDRIQESSQNVQESIHQSMEIQFKQQQEEFEKRFGQLFKMLQRPDPNVSVAPSALQELCDSVQTPKQRRNRDLPEDIIHSNSCAVTRISQPILQRTSVTGRECICHRSWRVATGRSIQLGHVYFSSEFATQRHWPTCPQSQLAPIKSRKTWGVKYTGLTRILKAAVDISFSYTFGAGGFSICLNFTYYPTVNDDEDCAFQVLKVLFFASWRKNLEKKELLMASCLRKLVKIFDGKKALPWSVNDRNESLVHCMTQIALELDHDARLQSLCLEFLQILISYGTPAFSYDENGLSPAVRIGRINPNFASDMIQFLVQENREDRSAVLHSSIRSLTLGRELDSINELQYKNTTYEITPRFAESCECGPLSLAVIRDDVFEVSRILDRSLDSLAERDIYGQSPIHLAAAKPRLLSLLVKAASIELLRLRDYSGFDALDMAMTYSSWQCVNGFSPDRCRQCSCTECVTILFKAGCSVRTHEHNDEGNLYSHLHEVLGSASELARRRYIFQMKVARVAQSRALPSHNGVRERHTGCRYGTIWTEPCVAASIEMPDTCNGKNGEEDWSWVYRKGGDPHLGDLFYRHGFRPHPSLFALLPSIKWMNLSVTYMCWLAEHGVDLFSRSTQHTVTDSSSTVGLFGAHFAFYYAHWNIDVATHTEDLAILLKHYEAVENRNLTDGCHCACTIGGCSPFIWMLKAKSIPGCGLGYAARDLVSKYQIYNTALTKLTYAAAIRFATFEALSLKHTCCEPRELLYGGELHDANDAGVMNEEQAKHLELHEELVAEFEEKAREFIERRTDNGTDFPNFWTSYWIDRIKQVLETLDGDELTDAERQGPEEIGVRWCEPPKPEVEEEQYASGSLEWYFHRLDTICPEYNEPWPDGLHRVTEMS